MQAFVHKLEVVSSHSSKELVERLKRPPILCSVFDFFCKSSAVFFFNGNPCFGAVSHNIVFELCLLVQPIQVLPLPNTCELRSVFSSPCLAFSRALTAGRRRSYSCCMDAHTWSCFRPITTSSAPPIWGNLHKTSKKSSSCGLDPRGPFLNFSAIATTAILPPKNLDRSKPNKMCSKDNDFTDDKHEATFDLVAKKMHLRQTLRRAPTYATWKTASVLFSLVTKKNALTAG